MAKKKSKIRIKPKNVGKFTATKKRTGKTTEQLTHSRNPVTKKRAIFAQNAAKWKKEYGGIIGYPNGGAVEEFDPYADTWSNVATGASVGASVGSIIPGLGTVIGGAIGGAAGLVTDLFQGDSEEAEFNARQKSAIKTQDLATRNLREQTPQTTYQPTLGYPDGGVVGKDAYGNPIYSNIPTGDSTATFTPNVLRPRTYRNTLDTAMGLGIPQEEFTTAYKANPQSYTESLASQYPNKYKAQQNSLGQWTLSEYMANPNKATEFACGGKIKNKMKKCQDGGRLSGANAELETDEVYRLPNGEIEDVPNGTPSHKQGGVELSLPEGTEILGKMKGKYNGKAYKDMGKDLKSKHDKYTKALENSSSTLLSKNTAKLMLGKVQDQFDTLMSDQEVQKNVSDYQTNFAKGGTVKKYATGDVVNRMTNPGNFPYTEDPNRALNPFYDDFSEAFGIPEGTEFSTPADATLTAEVDPKGTNVLEEGTTGDQGRLSAWYDQNLKGDVGSTLGTAAQFAPAAYNLAQGLFGKTDTLDAGDYANPYRNRILSSLRDRDINYNVRPELEANELAYQTARRNVRQLAPGVGSVLSNYGALAGTRMRADAQALARKQNIEMQAGLQARGQEASILSQLGGQEAQTKLGVDRTNRAMEAQKQQFLQEGIQQVAEAATQIKSTKSQKKKDKIMTDFIRKYANAYPELADMMEAYIGGEFE